MLQFKRHVGYCKGFIRLDARATTTTTMMIMMFERFAHYINRGNGEMIGCVGFVLSIVHVKLGII